MTLVSIAGLLVTAGAACVTDIHNRRIPNWLTFGSVVVAVAMHAAAPEGLPASQALLGWAAGICLFLPLFLLGGMGAGDVKLLGAFGAWVGAPMVLWLAAYASMAGGCLSLVVALRAGYLSALFRNTLMLLRYWTLVGPRPLPALTLERGTGPRLAFALPMTVGAMVAVWLQ